MRSVFYVVYLPAFVLAFANGIATPVLPIFARSFDVPFGAASLVVVLPLAGMAFSGIPTGYLIDRIGRQKVVLSGPALSALSSILTATAGSFPELLLWRFVNGWANGMWIMGRVTIIADQGGGNRARQITTMFSMDNVGRLLGPAVGGILATATDLVVPFYVCAILALLAAVPSIGIPEAPARAAGGRIDDTPARALSFRADILVFPITVLFATYFLTSLSRGALFGGSMNLYAAYAYDVDAAAIGFMAAAVSAAGIPVMMLAGRIMDRHGRKATIVPGFTMLGVGLILMAAIAQANLGFAVFVIAQVVIGLMQGFTGGSMQTLGSDIAPAHARGRFLGIWNTVGQFGTFLSPAVFGILADQASSASAFMFLALSSLAGAALIGFLVKEPMQSRNVVSQQA